MKIFANLISILFHPFSLIILLIYLVENKNNKNGYTYENLMLILGLIIIPTTVLMVYKVKTLKWQNMDASGKQERTSFYIYSIILILAVIVLLKLFTDYIALFNALLGILIMYIIMFSLSKWLKISLHLAFAGLCITILILLNINYSYYLIIIIPLLVWSRLILKRHSFVEVIIGLILGIITGVFIYFIN